MGVPVAMRHMIRLPWAIHTYTHNHKHAYTLFTHMRTLLLHMIDRGLPPRAIVCVSCRWALAHDDGGLPPHGCAFHCLLQHCLACEYTSLLQSQSMHTILHPLLHCSSSFQITFKRFLDIFQTTLGQHLENVWANLGKLSGNFRATFVQGLGQLSYNFCTAFG